MHRKRILIEIGHPAHVHHFKYMYWDLEKSGWLGLFVTKDKECAIELLEAYNLPYKVLGINKKGIVRKILSLPIFSLRMIKVAREFKPDILISRVSPLSGYASRLLRKPHITFTDTENVRLLDFISQPFADVILTSDVYLREHGKKQIRYPGYHELAYLHPSRFIPDRSVLEKAGIDQHERYAIVRFVSWSAHHDIGHSGFSERNRIKLVKDLSKYLRVYISTECDLPQELVGLILHVKAEIMHQILAHAHLFVGESATMASECAMLGTPAIYINNEHFGSTDSQSDYGLVSLFPSTDNGQQAAIELSVKFAQDHGAKKNLVELRNKMLMEKVDVTTFMVWFVDTFPVSADQLRLTPDILNRFKQDLATSKGECKNDK